MKLAPREKAIPIFNTNVTTHLFSLENIKIPKIHKWYYQAIKYECQWISFIFIFGNIVRLTSCCDLNNTMNLKKKDFKVLREKKEARCAVALKVNYMLQVYRLVNSGILRASLLLRYQASDIPTKLTFPSVPITSKYPH